MARPVLPNDANGLAEGHEALRRGAVRQLAKQQVQPRSDRDRALGSASGRRNAVSDIRRHRGRVDRFEDDAGAQTVRRTLTVGRTVYPICWISGGVRPENPSNYAISGI